MKDMLEMLALDVVEVIRELEDARNSAPTDDEAEAVNEIRHLAHRLAAAAGNLLAGMTRADR